MGKAETWTVLPHGKIEKISEDILRVEGSLASGPPLKRVMTVVRLENQDLVIHNAIALDEKSMKELEAFGKPKYLIVPNGWHRLDAGKYLQRYPDMKVYCPAGSRKKVEELVPVHGVYEEFPQNPRVRFETLQGIAAAEGVMIVEDKGETTLVFNDILFNMPHLKGIQGWILRHVTLSSGGPRITRVAKMAMIKDKRALAEHLVKLSGLPKLRRIIVSHHQMIESEPAKVIGHVAQTLID